MILVIDIGNTTIAFTGLKENRDPGPGSLPELDILFEKKLPTDTGKDMLRFVEEAENMLLETMADLEKEPGKSENPGEKEKLSDISLVAISSVVPACTSAAFALAEKLCKIPPVFISSSCDTGLSFERIGAPETIGADRLADIAWAAAGYPLPAMTVDLGTATTFNVIGMLPGGTRPAFIGGMIGAGVRTSLRALRALTAQLPAMDPMPVTPEEFIGTDTRTNMLSAAVVGTAAMIEGMAERVEEQLGEPVSLILTGGNAEIVSPWIRRPFCHEPALAAKGAAVIAIREARSREILE